MFNFLKNSLDKTYQNMRNGETESKDWILYLIENRGCTYVGVSPDPKRRLRQHNREIKGGAIYTTSRTPEWQHVCLVKGFQTKQQSMQFEWAVKHVQPRNAGGLSNRINKLYTVLCSDRGTSKAPLASTVPLQVEWLIPFNPHPPHDELPEYITEIFHPKIAEAQKQVTDVLPY